MRRLRLEAIFIGNLQTASLLGRAAAVVGWILTIGNQLVPTRLRVRRRDAGADGEIHGVPDGIAALCGSKSSSFGMCPDSL
jgi:hypothetical protein